MTAAATSHIFGIQTEIMMQLLGIIYKMGNPGAQIHTINQNIPGLLSYLYTSMERGDTSVINRPTYRLLFYFKTLNSSDFILFFAGIGSSLTTYAQCIRSIIRRRL